MPNPPSLERILYIDDEPMLQSLVRLSLNRARGWAVESCMSGALAVPSALATLPQIILLDVVLPDMDGVEVFAALRRESALAEVPIIFLSARCDVADRERYAALGGADMIPKPINPVNLADQIWTIWCEHHRP